MPRIIPSERFLDGASDLPKQIRRKLYRVVEYLKENPRHPSLRTKPVLGHAGIYEARVDQSYRFTYERKANDTLVLRNVGRHDETLKNP